MTRRSVADVAATPHFDFLYGSFNLSKWRLPYFATTMSLPDAAASLHLATELPGAEDVQWKVDELFQRDINWPRVERQILPYLRNTEVPQFFNSITVALVPFNPDSGELVQTFDVDRAWEAPALADSDRFQKLMAVGPVSFGFWEDWSTFGERASQTGQIRWNVKQVFGVTIDGQHRLAAIKLLTSDSSESSAIRETRLPVILLLFAPQLGFSGPSDTSQLDLLRRLFIDLNKHAQTVNRARQILLDDLDPHAVCVRRLVGNELTAHLDELSTSPPRLPLALVDWHSEQARFDKGPYLTTVLGLDWIIAKVLETRPIKDFTDYRAVRGQLDVLEKRLDIDMADARIRVEDLANVKLSPFTYLESELETIEEAFARIWSGPLCELLTKFESYAGIIDHRSTDGSFSLDFQYWYELYERKSDDQFEGHATQDYRRLLGRLANRAEHPIAESTLRVKLDGLNDLKLDSLAFNVVFQRAYVEAFLEYSKIGAVNLEELGAYDDGEELEVDFDDGAYEDVDLDDAIDGAESVSSGEQIMPGEVDTGLRDTVAARAREFVVALNRLVENWPELLSVSASFTDSNGESSAFWLGTLLKAEGGIDFTQGASTRAKDLLFAAAGMWLYADRAEPSAAADFEDFWYQLDAGPSICRRIGRAVGRFSKRESSAGGRILRARDEEHDEDAAVNEAYQRLKWLWEQLGL